MQGATRRSAAKLFSAGIMLLGLSGQVRTGATFRPEDFGAKGDGKTNDTDAFAAMSAAVTRAGGGTIVLRKTLYLVGIQRETRSPTAEFLLAPSPILYLDGCAGDVSIEGNGATLKIVAGLRYGVFDPVSKAPRKTSLPYYKLNERATPAAAIIIALNCRGALQVRDLTLDGNVDQLVIGGQWGDKGWQIGGSGIYLGNNAGDEILENIVCRNFPLDGIVIDGVHSPTGNVRRLVNVLADRNGRQGCSLVGGHGYVFERCRFTRTGKGPIASEPGAGVDIEPESGKKMSNLRFVDCTFSDNTGPGMLAATPDSSNASFTACTFHGTTSWTVWPAAPYYRFERCTFSGAGTNAFGDPDPRLATRFVDCIFTDTPPAGGDRRVFLGGGPSGPIMDLSTTKNVRFTRCRFELSRAGALPWSTEAVYETCTMRQRSSRVSYPRGTWVGRSTILGPVDLASSRILGSLSVNGVAIPRNG